MLPTASRPDSKDPSYANCGLQLWRWVPCRSPQRRSQAQAPCSTAESQALSLRTEPKQHMSNRKKRKDRSAQWLPLRAQACWSSRMQLTRVLSTTEWSAFASKSAVPCGRQRAQSCPRRILLRARPCDDPGFVPGNRARPSARSAELQAIHRRPLLHPRSPLHKAPPNPTCGVCSSAANRASHNSSKAPS